MQAEVKMMKDISRRDAIVKMAAGGAGLALMNLLSAEAVAANVEGQAPTSAVQAQGARAFRGQHQPRPLPFDPSKLKGLSEKLIRSHW